MPFRAFDAIPFSVSEPVDHPSPINSSPHTGQPIPNYFDDLTSLQIYFQSFNQSPVSTSSHNLLPSPLANIHRSRLLVTHDFKGGYADLPSNERGYTFEWLSAIDLFVYFSHHRVTIPPADWISAARTHHTPILGTLIFEHDASISDLELLLRGPSQSSSTIPQSYFLSLRPHPYPPIDRISSYFADRLIDLALRLGFQGWLLNFEVDLLQSHPTTSAPTARALRIWVEYLRLEGEKRVGPLWEVSWYDSLSHQDGRLQCCSRLDRLHNLPFYTAASSIFLDYHWPVHFPPQTAKLVDTLQVAIEHQSSSRSTPSSSPLINLTFNPLTSINNKQPIQIKSMKKDIYFGVDVYGRGCVYGGGFSSWKAAEVASRNGFSVALFAPGWTWESHHLHPVRERSKDWWSSWWNEERYQWVGLPKSESLDNTFVDACRIAVEAGQRTVPVRGTGSSEVPNHRPLLSLFQSLAQVNKSWSDSFYTNYSLGSGSNGYWAHGSQVMGFNVAWTDMASCFPKNDLSISGQPNRMSCNQPFITTSGANVRCETVDEVGWHGSGSVHISDELSTNDIAHDPGLLWINTLSLKLSQPSECRVVWRAEETNGSPLGIALDISPSESDSAVSGSSRDISSTVPILLTGHTNALTITDVEVIQINERWYETSCLLTPSASAPVNVNKFGLTIPSHAPFQHYLGQLSISPRLLSEKGTLKEHIIDICWSSETQTIHWNHQPGAITGKETIMYLVFLSPKGKDEVFLGTVRDAFIGGIEGPARCYTFKLRDYLIDEQFKGSNKILLKHFDVSGTLKVVGAVKV